MSRTTCLLAYGALLLAGCVDRPLGPGNHPAGRIDLRMELPPSTPAVWFPEGETLHVTLRRAGRAAPIFERHARIEGAAAAPAAAAASLALPIEVPFQQSVEGFVVTAEVVVQGQVYWLAFEALSVRAGIDTTITLRAAYVGPGARTATLALAPRTTVLRRDDTTSVVATTHDSLGQPTQNVPVRYTSLRPALVLMDARGGLARAVSASSDTVRVTGFTPTGVVASALLRLRTPTAVAPEGGDGQSGPPGAPLPAPLAVRVLDDLGQPVDGDTVEFAVTSGGGSLAPARVVTGADGAARAQWTLGDAEGPQTAEARVRGLPPVPFGAMAVRPAPDLVVNALLVSPAEPTTLDSIYLGAVVRNEGTAPAPAGVARLRILSPAAGEGAVVFEQTVAVAELAPGASAAIRAVSPPIAATGSARAELLADAGNTAAERSETNNEAARTFTVVAPTVARVEVSPTLATLRAPGATQQFTATAHDAAGRVVAGVSFAWQSSSPQVATVSSTGLATARGNGTTTITATAAGVSGSASLTVTLAGRQKRWLGTGGGEAGPSNWHNPANWEPAGVPTALDTVRVGAAANFPVLSSGTAEAAKLDVVGSGARLTITGGGTLAVHGDFKTGPNSGVLSMESSDATLVVRGNATFAGSVTAGLLTAGTLYVGGNFLQDYVSSNWAAFAPSGSHRTVLNGAAAQTVHFQSAAASGTQRSFFHHLEIANAGGGISIPQGLAVVNGELRVTTPASLTGPGELLVMDSLVTAAGSRVTPGRVDLGGGMAVGGTFAPETTEFFGVGQEIQPGLDYKVVRVAGTARIVGTTATGELSIDRLRSRPTSIVPGDLTIAGDTLIVHGDLTTLGSGGTLTMRDGPEGELTVVRVAGDATFAGAVTIGRLTGGTLYVGGNFRQDYVSSNWAAFAPSGTHRTVFDGTAPQTIHFESVAASGTQRSFFHHLEIAGTPGGVSIPRGTAMANGEVRVAPEVALTGAGRLVVGDSLVAGSGSRITLARVDLAGGMLVRGTFEPETTEFFGTNQEIQPGLGYRHVRVAGTARVVGPTTATGDLTIDRLRSQPTSIVPGDLTISGQTVTVGGDFATLPSGGTLTMTADPSGRPTVLRVRGDATFAGGVTIGRLTAGTLYVGGNFWQNYVGSNWAAFAPSGEHRTVLDGTGPQTIRFESVAASGTQRSFFHHLEIANVEGTPTLLTRAYVNGELRVEPAAGGTVTVAGAGADLIAARAAVRRLTLDNVPLVVAAPERLDTVTFRNFAPTDTQLTVSGPGAAEPYVLTDLRFLTAPTTGYYVRATDTAPSDGRVLTLHLDDSEPADGSGRTLTQGGAVVRWGGGNGGGSFAAAAEMTSVRTQHRATLLDDGRVLITGGRASAGTLAPTATADLFGVAGGLAATGSMAEARDDHTATLLPNGRVLVAGGGTGAGVYTSRATAELYDPAAGTFAAAGQMIGCDFRDNCRGRRRHTATLLPSGRVLLVGGTGTVGNQVYFLTTSELYNPATGTFAPSGRMAVARNDHTATLLADGRVLVAGGYNGLSAVELARADLYDPATGAFTRTGDMLSDRLYHTATRLPDGRVLIVGGQRQGGDIRLASAELYDPSTGTFTATGSMAQSRSMHAATLLADGRVLVTGGISGNFTATTRLATAEIYDPATGTFAPAGSMTSVRFDHTATLRADGSVLIAGGVGAGGGPLNSTELYTP